MGLTHDMETIIKAARHLVRDETVQFLLIGGGGKLSKIKDMARYYKLQNVTFLPYQPRENLKYSLSAAHVSLIALESNVKGLSVPSKLYGIMASGRPIVAIVPGNSEVALTLKEFKCGLITTPKDDLALAGTISWLKTNESARKAMGKHAYRAFLENFTVQICANKYSELLKQII
jgi:glycosyltransferase involved in cell wall biosynthesis